MLFFRKLEQYHNNSLSCEELGTNEVDDKDFHFIDIKMHMDVVRTR